jgi:hypothetical protein
MLIWKQEQGSILTISPLKFRENTNWLAFDEFAFGIRSPIYHGRRSHFEVLQSALYLVLKDMSLQLGVQQGLIKRTKKTEKKAVA